MDAGRKRIGVSDWLSAAAVDDFDNRACKLLNIRLCDTMF